MTYKENSPARLIEQFKQLPCTDNSGDQITYISEALDHLSLKIPFNEQTQNFMDIFHCGSMHAATDAIYLCML